MTAPRHFVQSLIADRRRSPCPPRPGARAASPRRPPEGRAKVWPRSAFGRGRPGR